MSALCVYLTISRGGALALAVGVVVFLLFVPRRLHAIGTLLVAGAGSAILLAGASQRDAVQDGVVTAAAQQQGTELIWLALIVCAGVALLQVAIGLAARHLERPALLAPSPRTVIVGAVTALAIVGAIGVAARRAERGGRPVAGVQGPVRDRRGGRRGQRHQPALGRQRQRALRGLAGGAGCERNRRRGRASAPGPSSSGGRATGPRRASSATPTRCTSRRSPRPASSGCCCSAGCSRSSSASRVVRSLRATSATLRIWIAAAVAGLAAFLTSAAFEWVWEMAAIACVVMLLGAVIVAGRDDDAPADARPDARRRAPRAVLAVLALGALSAIAVPMAGALATRDSHRAAADGRLATALADSHTAQRLQPYAATPRLQRALVLEQAGVLAGAASAARGATAEEPTNWRTWFVLARIEAQRGNDARALSALRTAKRLNPRSPLVGGS